MDASRLDINKLFIPGAILIAGFIIAIGAYFGLAASGGGGVAAPSVDIDDIALEGAPFIGNENAPAVMAYWADFQCPFCKQYEKTIQPTLIQQYVDTGKLKIVFKDFAFLGPDSTTAALAARAVWEAYPNRYFAWREAMFEAQDEEHGGFGDEASVLALTGKIEGIDVSRIRTLMKEKETTYMDMIEADVAEGQGVGVSGTPGFVIGEKLIVGLDQLQAYTAAIEEQL